MPQPALHLYTSNRLEVLLGQLARTLDAEPLPPLAREVIVVQSQGMSRWLTLGLARHLGIAASLTMPFPSSFCRYLAQRLLEREDDPHRGEASRFERDTLTWRIFSRLGHDGPLLSQSAFAEPRRYLAEDPDQRKRYQLACRLAILLDDYQLFRPEMLLAWQEGAAGEGRDEVWQAALWRSLAEDAGEDHLALRFTRLLERLRQLGPGGDATLPRRLSVFGVSTLPPVFLRLLEALSRHLPVGIYFTSPTYHYWGDLRSDREAERLQRRLRGSGIPAGELHVERGHPLLAGLGRQGRDFFNLLQEVDEDGAAWHELDFAEPPAGGVLHALQADILHLVDRGPGGGEPPLPLPEGDRSLTLHACHSPMREMEVLRDQLLAAFAEDPELRPSDVLVLVPEIAQYSPYVQAVFGGEHEGAPALPFAVADRRAGQELPPAESTLRLLDLIGDRLTVRAVFDFLDVPAVRRAFGVPARDVPVLRQWAEDTRVRWGMDGAQRRDDFELPAEEANTWRAGIDRLLMGYAAGDLAELVAGTVPHAGSTAGNAELLGRLASFVDTLFHHLRELRRRRPADRWASALGDAVEALFGAEGEAEERGLQLVRDAIAELAELRHRAGLEEAVSLEVVRAHLAAKLAEPTHGGGFLTGRITFCALKPMRTIPFKVICVAGLADGAFPRREVPRGFDLMARRPRRGDRSLTEDDRYLFLETLLAAGEKLILTWVGSSQKDGRERAPSVVVSELLDHLDRSFAAADGRPARRHLVVRHRLQPWSPAYFDRRDDALFSTSRENLEAGRLAAAASRGRGVRAEAPFVAAAAPPETEEAEIELLDLIEFWVHPARLFCRKTLELTLALSAPEDADSEPFDIAGLAGYQLREDMLARRLEQAPRRESELELLRARGELPLAGLGGAHYAALAGQIDAFRDELPPFAPLPPLLLELAGEGWRLHGQLEGLTDLGLIRFRTANLKPKDRLRAWVAHVAYNAWAARCPEAAPAPCDALVVGRDRRLTLPPLAAPEPLLGQLVAGYLEGLRQPLPVFENASYGFAFQELRRQRGEPVRSSPMERARAAWRSERPPNDAEDPYVELCFRGREPLTETAFGDWARRLWRPLLEHGVEER